MKGFMLRKGTTLLYESDDVLVTSSRPGHFGPAGMMGDHVHDKGGLMLGLDVKPIDFGGANRLGTDKISDMEIAAAGYSKRTQAMTMDMVMFHLMYAPDDRLTYSVMPMWMHMDMTMVGIGMPMMDGMMPGHGGHHHLAPGETMRHSTEGFGDTEIGALYALSKAPRLGAIAGVMLSVPTGSVDRRNEDGSFNLDDFKVSYVLDMWLIRLTWLMWHSTTMSSVY